MMYWGNGDWNWAAWVAMTASMVLFWGLVAWVVVTIVRRPGDPTARPKTCWPTGSPAARSTTTSTGVDVTRYAATVEPRYPGNYSQS